MLEVMSARKLHLRELIQAYRVCCLGEGKSLSTVAIVEASVRKLEWFLRGRGLPLDVLHIGAEQLREFAAQLRESPRFTHHRFTKQQDGRLAGHSVNGYMRALRSLWTWLEKEGFIAENPFKHIKIPKATKKVIPTFSAEQLKRLFSTVDTSSAIGFRNYTLMLLLLDTGLRCSEVIGLRLGDIDWDTRLLKVTGKGAKERFVPFGGRVSRYLYRYVTLHRPQPALPMCDKVFLTRTGHPLTKDRVEAIVERYGKKAGIAGVRVSPHTFRHTMAVSFLRNGGDVFSLQQILGHSTLDVVRNYVNLALSDVASVHQRSSPADNLDLKPSRQRNKRVNRE